MSKKQRDDLDKMLRGGPLNLAGDVKEQRKIFDKMMTEHPLPKDVITKPGTLNGVKVLNIDIVGAKSDDVILYLHGGAYAIGTAATTADLASNIVRLSGVRAVSVDYRLAPEFPYPAAVEDAVAAYKGLLDNGTPASNIAMVGESAGGGLVLATLLSLKSAGLPQPSSAVLMSPWADLTLSGESMKTKAAVDPALTPAGLRLRASDYVADNDASDPLISPVFADLTGLPRLLIQVGSREILLDDAMRIATQAENADVAVTLEVTPDVPHVFPSFAAILDEGDSALKSSARFLRSNLDPKPV